MIIKGHFSCNTEEDIWYLKETVTKYINDELVGLVNENIISDCYVDINLNKFIEKDKNNISWDVLNREYLIHSNEKKKEEKIKLIVQVRVDEGQLKNKNKSKMVDMKIEDVIKVIMKMFNENKCDEAQIIWLRSM